MIAKLTKLPSILFISETRVHDEKEVFQKSQIKIAGYTFVLDNSQTCAGGTAINVSDNLIYEERDDIIFNYPNVEACFVEIKCKKRGKLCVFLSFVHHKKFQSCHISQWARPPWKFNTKFWIFWH